MNAIEQKIALEALQQTFKMLGGPSAIAKKFNIKPQSVADWFYKTKRVPAERVLELEKLVNGRVSRYRYRPDIYGYDITDYSNQTLRKS